MTEKFLDSAEVGAVGEQMGGESVAERVRVEIPVHVYEADVFFYDAADGALREAAAGVVQEDGGGMRSGATVGAGTGLLE